MAAIGIDPTRLLPQGNAFWDEGWGALVREKDGVAQTRIRTLKVGELYNNSTFVYCENALDLAESMAFNVNCLGCVAWFEWGRLIAAHQQSGTPPSKELKPYIRFFLDHQDLYRHWPSVSASTPRHSRLCPIGNRRRHRPGVPSKEKTATETTVSEDAYTPPQSAPRTATQAIATSLKVRHPPTLIWDRLRIDFELSMSEFDLSGGRGP